jgi:hypothetical protein
VCYIHGTESVLRRPVEFALDSAVGMVYQLSQVGAGALTSPDSHVQRVQGEVSAQTPR